MFQLGIMTSQPPVHYSQSPNEHLFGEQPLTVTPVVDGISVAIANDVAPLEKDLQTRVDTYWDEAMASGKHAHLFDGKVLSVDEFVETEEGHMTLTGHWVGYRQFFAQQQHPDLFDNLQVRPLGVTALLTCQDGIVIGRRGWNVTQDKHTWELAPSGSVDPVAVKVGNGKDSHTIDLEQAVLTELREELGLAVGELIYPPHPFAVVEDHTSHVIDIGLALMGNHPTKTIQQAWKKAPKKQEYTHLKVLTLEELSKQSNLAPVSQALIDAFTNA